jgi:hypothetical protein
VVQRLVHRGHVVRVDGGGQRLDALALERQHQRTAVVLQAEPALAATQAVTDVLEIAGEFCGEFHRALLHCHGGARGVRNSSAMTGVRLKGLGLAVKPNLRYT